MKKNSWLFLFIISLVANLAGIFLEQETIQLVSKPLIIISLAGYFIAATKKADHLFKPLILFALLFSWMGDVLLIFQGRDQLFFLLGLSSFLVAHIFYIIFFHRVRLKEALPARLFPLIVVVVYYARLMLFLSPYLNEMKWPVRVYGVVISIMFMLALHMRLKNRVTGLLMMGGALLFVASDSLLAINKFYKPFEGSGLLIMLTYGLAQLFIVEGAKRYITSAVK